MSFPIIQKAIKTKEQKEAEEKLKNISEGVHKALTTAGATALEAELVLTQMAQSYATVAKTRYIIREDNGLQS